MTVFIDKDKQLNYNPLFIYFLLTNGEYERNIIHLNEINRYKGMTRGIFTYKMVIRGISNNEQLSDDLDNALSNNNIILRLFDKEDGSFVYALEKVNFAENIDNLSAQIKSFIIDACEYNLNTIRSRSNLSFDSSARLDYRFRHIYHLLKEAILLNDSKLKKWGQTRIDDNKPFCGHAPSRPLPRSYSVRLNILEEELKAVVPKHKRESVDRLMSLIKEFMTLPTESESDKLATEAVKKSSSRSLVLDQKSRIEPSTILDVKITIARIPYTDRYRHRLNEWGLIFTINNQEFSLHIRETIGAMLIFGALLKQKANDKLYRDFFRKQHKQEEEWLKNLYDTLFPQRRNFAKWFENLLANDTTLRTGISNARRDIRKCIESVSDALYYCKIQTKTESGKSYYYFNLPSECIIVPERFNHLL